MRRLRRAGGPFCDANHVGKPKDLRDQIDRGLGRYGRGGRPGRCDF